MVRVPPFPLYCLGMIIPLLPSEALNEGSILMMYVSVTIRIDMHMHSWASSIGDA